MCIPKRFRVYYSLRAVVLALFSRARSLWQAGTFQTVGEDDTSLSHTFERGDLLIFQSHKYHSVTPVLCASTMPCTMRLLCWNRHAVLP